MIRLPHFTLRMALILAHDLAVTALAVVAAFYIRFEEAGLALRWPLLVFILPAFVLYAGLVFALFGMFKTWRREYWLPIETNREFASHFDKPNAWVRLFRDVRMAFRRFLRRPESAGLPVEDFAAARATPAE